jgi:hypothetical protein
MSALSPAPRRNFLSWRPISLGVVLTYLLVAYVILPQWGKEEALWHPDRLDGARLTHTAGGLPGDPLNISFVGSAEEIGQSLLATGWKPATALGFKSDIKIAVDTVLGQPDPNAPVSNLFLFGRKEDVAYEKPIGHSPRERHHMRLWKTTEQEGGRAVWIGGATQDVGVELSHTTEQVTHRISPEVDAERDFILAELTAAGRLSGIRWIDAFHKERQGRNGGGDPWHTDGRLPVAMLRPASP